jgi:AraC-like DNA-binding protein
MDGGYFRKVFPDSCLHDYIRSYTFINIPFEQARKMEFLVMPSSHTRMILFIGEPSLESIADTFQKVESNSLTGLYSRPHLFLPTASIRQVIIHFTPWGIQPFLDFSLSDITDSRADLKDIFKSELDKLRAELLMDTNLLQKQQALDTFFKNQLLKKKTFDKRIKPIVQHIFKGHGSLKLSKLSKDVFIGERTIQRLIHNSVGVNYKFFAKLVRLEHAAELLKKGNLSLNEVALCAGYFDQAHFIHEFKSFYNEKPSSFLKKHRNMVWNLIGATQESAERKDYQQYQKNT